MKPAIYLSSKCLSVVARWVRCDSSPKSFNLRDAATSALLFSLLKKRDKCLSNLKLAFKAKPFKFICRLLLRVSIKGLIIQCIVQQIIASTRSLIAAKERSPTQCSPLPRDPTWLRSLVGRLEKDRDSSRTPSRTPLNHTEIIGPRVRISSLVTQTRFAGKACLYLTRSTPRSCLMSPSENATIFRLLSPLATALCRVMCLSSRAAAVVCTHRLLTRLSFPITRSLSHTTDSTGTCLSRLTCPLCTAPSSYDLRQSKYQLKKHSPSRKPATRRLS